MERLTSTRKRILQTLYENSPADLYGNELGEIAGIASGSLYVALAALREAGFIQAEWRAPKANSDGQPLRYYKLTENGYALAHAIKQDAIRGTEWRRFVRPAT